MTTAELQTMRTNIIAALNGTLAAGIASYGIDGRDVRNLAPMELFQMLNLIDSQIDRATNGGFFVMQTRDPD